MLIAHRIISMNLCWILRRSFHRKFSHHIWVVLILNQSARLHPMNCENEESKIKNDFMPFSFPTFNFHLKNFFSVSIANFLSSSSPSHRLNSFFLFFFFYFFWRQVIYLCLCFMRIVWHCASQNAFNGEWKMRKLLILCWIRYVIIPNTESELRIGNRQCGFIFSLPVTYGPSQ